MNRPVRLGIIGCGNVLDAYMTQCDKLRTRAQAELIIGCGREGQRERALELGLSTFTTQEKDVLSSPDIDVVIILTSMNEHARVARAAIEAGKHVLLEKPLATNLEDAQKLVTLARERRCRLVCAPFTILSPTFQTMRGRIERGDIGTPCLARA